MLVKTTFCSTSLPLASTVPLFTVLNSAVNKSHQHHKENYWEHPELNPEPLGEKQDCNLRAVQPHVLIKPFFAYNFGARETE